MDTQKQISAVGVAVAVAVRFRMTSMEMKSSPRAAERCMCE